MIIQSRYGVFAAPAASDLITSSLHHYEEWAQVEIDILSHFIQKDSIVVDVGAYIGTHSRAFSELVGSGGNVYAFEPNGFIYPFLVKNTKNIQHKNITIYPFALGAAGEKRKLINGKNVQWNFGAVRLEPMEKEGDELDIDVKMLDDMNIDRVDFIKIDVEGMELEVLDGAEKTIEQSKPIIFQEVNSLEASHAILGWAHLRRYSIFGVIASAYNPNNFNRSQYDIFDGAKECGLLLIHQEKGDSYLNTIEEMALSSIESVDDIALLLLHKPQYPHEVLKNATAAEKLGVHYHSPALEEAQKKHDRLVSGLEDVNTEQRIQISSLSQEVNKLDQENTEQRKQVSSLTRKVSKFEQANTEQQTQISSLTREVSKLQQVNTERRTQISSLIQEIEEITLSFKGITASKSWRLTRPLRILSRLFMRGVPLVTGNSSGSQIKDAINELFDSGYYQDLYPEAGSTGLSAIDHFIKHGYLNSFNPHPLFDSAFYL